MFFANLGLFEFLALFGSVSAVTVALYLLSRARKRHSVSTLRFWAAAAESAKQQHRRRIDQPWSLLLQLLSVLLLLLAIAQPRIGKRDDGSRDHVLLLDTSAWTGARLAQGNWLREIQIQALRWVRALPVQDRVMVVRVDSTPAPATRFESDRRVIEEAIRRSHPGAGAFVLDEALEFAANAQRLNAKRLGEVVYTGSGRITTRAAALPAGLPKNLRVLPVVKHPVNVGITRVNMRRSAADSQIWEGVMAVRNYTNSPRAVSFAGALGGSPAVSGTLNIAAAAESVANFEFRSRAAGWFDLRLGVNDDLALDNRLTIELPALKTARVIVYSDEPALFRPLLAADPRVEASYSPRSAYSPEAPADLVILDRMGAVAAPKTNAIWVRPAPGGAIGVKPAPGELTITDWPAQHPLSAGLRTKDLRLSGAETFTLADGDVAIAESAAGPLIAARGGQPKAVFLGFHPFQSAMRFELVTPLLFGNVVHWMVPEVFRQWDIQALTIGAVQVALPAGADPKAVRVSSDGAAPVPYTIDGSEVRLFSAEPATVRVLAGSSEQVVSMSLPRISETAWDPPASVRRDLRGLGASTALPRETWPWLAALGLLGLLADWFLFGRQRPWKFWARARAPEIRLRRAS